jgi:hypothetical protein
MVCMYFYHFCRIEEELVFEEKNRSNYISLRAELPGVARENSIVIHASKTPIGLKSI